MTTIILPILIVLVLFGVFNFISKRFGENTEISEVENPYEKKPFVFDVMSELSLYRILIDVFSDKYYVFPQMSYGRIIQLKENADKWERNRFDKKIADFVLCDKERAVAMLVIELDGSSHSAVKKTERDVRVDNMMTQIGLPILHLSTDNFDKEFIKNEVAKKLNIKL